MKKVLLILCAALMVSTSAVMAQKVDVVGIKEKLAKIDADSENPKKGAKAATWINRGNQYFNSIKTPLNDLLQNGEVSLLELQCGKAQKRTPKKIGKQQFQILTFPFFSAYSLDNKVVAWTLNPAKFVDKDALKKSIESYEKALEIDPGVASKVKSAMEEMVKFYTNLGELAINIQDVKAGALAYINATTIEKSPAYGGKVDASHLFYAGYLLSFDGEKTPASYVRGEALLKEALAAGYTDFEDARSEVKESERGNIYFYAYLCAYAQRTKNKAKIEVAKKFLNEGFNKYPKNANIFDCLLSLYTTAENNQNPEELLGTIEKAVKANPKKTSAWYAQGVILFTLKKYDEGRESFVKVLELEPNSYDGNFYMAYYYVLKGDQEADLITERMKTTNYTQAKLDEEKAVINKYYLQSIPYFEKAHAAKPKDETVLDYLKRLCFQLRDEPGIMEKYTKYNELFKAL